MLPPSHPCPKCGLPVVGGDGLDPANAACPHCAANAPDSESIMDGPLSPPFPATPGNGWDSLADPEPDGGPPPSATSETPDTPDLSESIFGDENVDTESVLGIAERRPTEFPPPVDANPDDAMSVDSRDSSASSGSMPVPMVLGFAGPPPAPMSSARSPKPVTPGADWGSESGADELPAPVVAPPPPVPVATQPIVDDPSPPRSGLVTWLLVVYAVAATVAAVLGWARSGPDGHPLSVLSDLFGEYEPARRTTVTGLPGPNAEIPDELRVALGKTLTVGDLQITPTAIAEERVMRNTQRADADDEFEIVGERIPTPCLVLRATVTNRSSDTTFHPVDPAFNRKAVLGEPAVVGIYPKSGRAFVGGPIAWPFAQNVQRVYLDGQKDDNQPLGPGQSRDVMICSAIDDDLVPSIRKAKGPVLWKLQFRRGRVKWGFRTVPVTTLVGVEFTADKVDWSDKPLLSR